MEEIKCRRCRRKKPENENWNGLRTCPICHEKDRGDSRVRSEKRKQNRPSVELVENLKFTEPLPKFLQNFSEYQAYWRKHGQETKFEDYMKDLNTHKMREVQKQTDTQIAKTKGQFRAKKQILMKFLCFDLYEPSNREDCTKFRLQKLGLWHEEPNWLNEHLETCEGCKFWLSILLDDVLCNQDGLFVHLAYAEDFKNLEEFQQVKKRCPHHGVKAELVTFDEQLKKITVTCDPNSIPEKEYEFPEDRYTNCCPFCGTPLKDGKCPNFSCNSTL